MSRHLNDDPEDNRLINLCYGTAAENRIDCLMNERQYVVLTKEKREQAYKLRIQGLSCNKISKLLKVQKSVIINLLTGRTWGEVDTRLGINEGFKYISLCSKALTPGKRKKARRLFASGLTCAEIAVKFDMPYSTMQKLLARNTWKSDGPEFY